MNSNEAFGFLYHCSINIFVVIIFERCVLGPESTANTRVLHRSAVSLLPHSFKKRFPEFMVLYGELVCNGCSAVLSYPLGAISARCRNCQTVNAALHIQVDCPSCNTDLLLPANTVLALCPCCLCQFEIPMDMLPEVPTPRSAADHRSAPAEMAYIQHPQTIVDGKLVPNVSVATRIA